MSESELSEIDELVEIESRTNGDGTVDVTIEDWKKTSDSRVKVIFQLVDHAAAEDMAWPEPGEGLHDNKFYRLVKSCNLDMRNADLLEGETAKAYNDGRGWLLDVPECGSTTERIKRRVRAYLLSGWESFKELPFKDIVITLFWMASVVFLMGFIVAAVV